jgi:hypothetical protein
MAQIIIPQSIRLTLQNRVGRLPEQAQETLRMAAVIGREFEFATLQAALSSLSEDDLIDALETAERAQLIQEIRSPANGQITFAFADGDCSRRHAAPDGGHLVAAGGRLPEEELPGSGVIVSRCSPSGRLIVSPVPSGPEAAVTTMATTCAPRIKLFAYLWRRWQR